MIIKNAGQRIIDTDYWDSEHAQRGLMYLTWNAGAARLLLPDAIKSELREMRGASCVIISRGPWHEQGGCDALELLFEDGSDSPYVVHLVAEQTDRLLPEDNQGGGFVVTVWTRAGQKLRRPGKYREVDGIPCLQPWSTQ